MAKKMPRRLVALSASAVATIYLAGLMSTQPVAESVAATAADTSVVATTDLISTATSTPSVVVGASAAATPTASATATSTAAGAATPGTSATATPATASTATPGTSAMATSTATGSAYADGTYSATGTSRFGNVTASVTIASGKISNVQITKVTTSFPMSRIASLPAQVISAQSANVNVVTGATYSSQAFKQAVQTALTQAQARG
jgi:uncharacterized protein with FMN-binding domain